MADEINKGEFLRSIRNAGLSDIVQTNKPHKITRRQLLKGMALATATALGAGALLSQRRQEQAKPSEVEEEDLAKAIKDFEEKVGNASVTVEMAQQFAPLVVKLYCSTCSVPKSDEITKKIKFDSRSPEEIYGSQKQPTPTGTSEDRRLINIGLYRLNQNDPKKVLYPDLESQAQVATPIAKLRSEVVRLLYLSQIFELAQKEADPALTRAFAELDFRKAGAFDQALRQMSKAPNLPDIAIVKTQGFNFTSDYFDDTGHLFESGGSYSLDRIVSSYLTEKMFTDNGLSLVQNTYDLDAEEFVSLREVLANRARLSDTELYGMVMRSDVSGFISRLHQAQNVFKFNSDYEKNKFWLSAFSNESNRTSMWTILPRAFPGIKVPSIVYKGYK